MGFPAAKHVLLPARPGAEPVTLAVHEQGSGFPVVFSHGFPELAYSWRYQLPALAAAGFRAIAPDQRGYGGSSIPTAIDQYGVRELTADLVGMLDALGIDKAVFVGHDWGGFVTWAMPLLYPERTAGVVGICTPYMAMPSMAVLRPLFAGEDERFYILWFQQPGVAEAVLDADPYLVFERLMRGGVPPQELLAQAFVDGKLHFNPFNRLHQLQGLGTLVVSPEELGHYVDVFRRTGFRGGINWYRNIDRNAREYPQIGVQPLSLPCLMLTAEWDGALRPEMAAGMPSLCSDLEMQMIQRAGHWVQQEYPSEVNAALIDWLGRRFGAQ